MNLHAHGHVWLGLTNGRGSADDVLRRYRAMGYDAAPVSNYQAITRAAGAAAGSLAVYEQGYNVRKAHFLAVAPRSVDWLDYPLMQSRDAEQHRIDRLRASAGLVIMAHPRLRNAFADTDLRALTGYAAMEIGSNQSRSIDAWNTALDAGRPVWGVADDDAHDPAVPNETGNYWTMIAASGVDAARLVGALTAGRAYAVFGRQGRADVFLSALSLAGDTLSIALRGAPAEIELVGPAGHVLAREANARTARWVIPCDASWVRVVARTSTTQILLQPLLRSETGEMPGVAAATTAIVPTLVRRALAVMLLLIGAMPIAGRLLGARSADAAPPRMWIRKAA